MDEISTFTVDRCEHLVRHLHIDSDLGVIDSSARLPMDTVIDVALGLRDGSSQSWFDPQSHSSCTVEKLDDGLHLTYSASNGTQHMWVMEPDHGRIVHYEMEQTNGVKVRIDCDEFKNYNGIDLPMHVKAVRSPPPGEEGYPEERTEIRVRSYNLDQPANDISKYKILWTVGSGVIDKRSGQSVVIKDHDQVLTGENLNARAAQMQGALLPSQLNPLAAKNGARVTNVTDRSVRLISWVIASCVAAGLIVVAIRIGRRVRLR